MSRYAILTRPGAGNAVIPVDEDTVNATIERLVHNGWTVIDLDDGEYHSRDGSGPYTLPNTLTTETITVDDLNAADPSTPHAIVRTVTT
jgi:hypothetical protein